MEQAVCQRNGSQRGRGLHTRICRPSPGVPPRVRGPYEATEEGNRERAEEDGRFPPWRRCSDAVEERQKRRGLLAVEAADEAGVVEVLYEAGVDEVFGLRGAGLGIFGGDVLQDGSYTRGGGVRTYGVVRGVRRVADGVPRGRTSSIGTVVRSTPTETARAPSGNVSA